jgi:hypothetical protein
MKSFPAPRPRETWQASEQVARPVHSGICIFSSHWFRTLYLVLRFQNQFFIFGKVRDPLIYSKIKLYEPTSESQTSVMKI